MKNITILALLLIVCISVQGQTKDVRAWNSRKCAVAITYDDGLNVHLDNVIPVLDSAELKATFYLTGNSAALEKRMAEWKAVADNGHELGNHTLFHPCAGKSKGRQWVQPYYDLDNYSINQIVNEIRLANTFLKAVDGKTKRTFAFTCGDNSVRDSVFTGLIHNDFVAARTVVPKIERIGEIDFFNIGTYPVSGQTGEELIDIVKKAVENGAFITFLFHGVGGEHNLNVALADHNKLIAFLKDNQKDIWVAPLVEIAEYAKNYKSLPTGKVIK